MTVKHNLSILMENENQVQDETTKVSQEQELEINLDAEVNGSSASDVVEKSKFDQVFARAKKAEAELKALKSKSPEVKKEVTPEPRVDKKGYDLDEVTDLRLDGYSKEEVKFIMNNGGRKALADDPFVKVAIEQIRTQKKAENAIPAEDTGKSEIERKYTAEQLNNMSADELYKILPKAQPR